jgi:hypothetical protein
MIKQKVGAAGWSLTREQIAALDDARETTRAYPHWSQAAFTERNLPPA